MVRSKLWGGGAPLRWMSVLLIVSIIGSFQQASAQGPSKVDTEPSGSSGTQESLDRVRAATNCQKSQNGLSQEYKIAFPKQITLYAYPDTNGPSAVVDVARDSTIEIYPLAFESNFVCVRLASYQTSGWVSDLEVNSMIIASAPLRSKINDGVTKVALCARRLPASMPITRSLAMFGAELVKYNGCAGKSEHSYLISLDNHVEIQNRLITFLMSSDGADCANLLGEAIQSLGEVMQEMRSTFPNCGKHSQIPIPVTVIAPNGLNVRDFWIEAASARITGTVTSGMRAELYDVVGTWGYFHFPARQSQAVRSGWMNLKFTDYGRRASTDRAPGEPKSRRSPAR